VPNAIGTRIATARPKTSIGWFQFLPRNLSLQHDDLVSKGENFNLKIRTTPEMRERTAETTATVRPCPRSLRRQVQSFQSRWDFQDGQIDIDDPATKAAYQANQAAGLSEARARIDGALESNNLQAIVFAGQSGNTIVTRAAYPAVMVRAGYQAGTLHPEGLEIIGTAYSEARLLNFAYAYEQATHLWQPPSKINPTLFRCVGVKLGASSCP